MQEKDQTKAPAADIAPGVLSVSTAAPTSSTAQTTTAPHGSSLTKREQAILELMAFGLTNKEIARRLTLSRRTVETHIDHVLRKLDVPTRTRAVSEAVRLGLLGGALANAAAMSRAARPTNLPFQLTTLVGREQDLADLKSLLEANRLLTLSGSGGVGKTRLALQVGVDFLDLYPEGVWFCDFSPISGSELVARTVARVLGVREQQNRPLVDSLVHALKRKHTLLILDNCEHVLDAAAELTDEILHNCPNIRILATSRQPFGIIGEVVHRVRSLECPETSAGLKADRAMRYGAIALFADRARASDASFTLSSDSAPIVADICRRLDGIPLAIELAAVRTNVVSVSNLAQSLDDRFKVLTVGSRTALPRHKTLMALIDWSYDLLSPREQKLFSRLGVFAGSFSLSAVTVVCSGDGLDESNISDLVVALVDKSLVVVEVGETQERYRLLDSTRAYALERLSSGERERLVRRHAKYFCDRAQVADERYGIGSIAAWLGDAELELDNYRATLKWALADLRDAALGGALAGALGQLWQRGGLAAEGKYWIDAGLEAVSENERPEIVARLWRELSHLSSGKHQHEAADRAVRLYESVGNSSGAAHALVKVARGLVDMGRIDEADEAIARAMAAFREHADTRGIADCLAVRAGISCERGDFAGGRQFFSQVLSARKELGDELGAASIVGNLAELEFADGHADLALKMVNEALTRHVVGKELFTLGAFHNNRAAYCIALGDLGDARESAREGLRWARLELNAWNVSNSVQHLALLAALRGQTHDAARLVGYVNAQYKQLGQEREATERWSYEKLMATLREHLSEVEIEALAAEGTEWSEDRAVEVALAI